MWFLISIGLKVRTFKWRNAGVWPSTMGRLPTMTLSVLYILGCRCLITPWVDPTPLVMLALIKCPTIKGPNSLTVTLPGRLYRHTPSLGLIMTMEWLEQLMCPFSRPRWKWFRPFPSTLDRDPSGWPRGLAMGWLW